MRARGPGLAARAVSRAACESVPPASLWIWVSSADFIAAAFGPTASVGKTTSAEGVDESKLSPNSTAPRVVLSSSALISRSIAWTRSRLGSVTDIEPESSTIASTLVARVHAAAVATLDACPELGASTATISPPTISPRTERAPRMCWPSFAVGPPMGPTYPARSPGVNDASAIPRLRAGRLAQEVDARRARLRHPVSQHPPDLPRPREPELDARPARQRPPAEGPMQVHGAVGAPHTARHAAEGAAAARAAHHDLRP